MATIETVAELLGDTPEIEAAPERIEPPRRKGAPPFPEPGLYFGMDDATYHAIHACSASGLKNLSISNMDYWANSPLNPEKDDEEESKFKELGRAYHCRILEGVRAFNERYAALLDKRDYKDLIVTIDDACKAIEKAGFEPPKKGMKKELVMVALAEACPDALVWDALVQKHAEHCEGKVLIARDQINRIHIAAAMIENDPHLKNAVGSGHPEVAMFWYCPRTGVPMKAKLDYLKLRSWIDLKSFANKMGRPIQRAIDYTIAQYKYYLPVVVYDDGVKQLKQLVKDTNLACVHGPETMMDELRHFCWNWAHQPDNEVLFIFQQSGKAPVTRGRRMIRGSTYEINRFAVEGLKKRWRECALAFGTDPWVDVAPVVDVVDEELPMSATEYGVSE